MAIKTKILATGMGLPKKILTNKEIEQKIDTSHDWIVERTGIHERRVSDPNGGEFPSDLAVLATKEACEKAGIDVNEIDMIILATTIPDMIMPNTSSIIQSKLGMTNKCGCIDLAAACSGFVYGFNMGHAMIHANMAKKILVVGADMLSRGVNWEDRSTCILFGDGCGVAILSANDDNSDQSEVLATQLSSDSSGLNFLEMTHGGAQNPMTHEAIDNKEYFIKMQGREIFKVATRTLSENSRIVCKKAGVTLDDIDWVVPHQANFRIIETTAKLLGLPLEKVIINIDKYGNTSAGTIPMALHEGIEDNRIKRGDLVLFTSFGAGLTSGATLFRY